MAHGVSGHGRGFREKRNEVERAESLEEQEHTDHEAEVADAVDDEGFFAGVRRGFAQEIKADEQVARKTDTFPADEKKDVVGGEDQDQHEEHEEIEEGEKAGESALVGHVAGGVDVDEP